jgi:hypothetical protein
MLLNKSITLVDIEAVDPDLHQSLTWMLNNCIEIKEIGQGNIIISCIIYRLFFKTITVEIDIKIFGIFFYR